jgi:hypothetical protein
MICIITNRHQTPTVYMASTLDSSTTQIPIPFSDPSSRSRNVWRSEDSFGIGSCRFSADGNEVVAGGNGKLFGMLYHFGNIFSNCVLTSREVFDLLANRRTIKISAHDDDINSCCWADTVSGNVLISASDDTFLKVWYVCRIQPCFSPQTKIPVQGSSLAWYIAEALWRSDWPHRGSHVCFCQG